jgi:transposase
MLHRARDLLIRQRTMLANALRAHLAEFGIVAAQGLSHVGKLLAIVADEEDDQVPAVARTALSLLAAQWCDLQVRIKDIEGKIGAWHRADATSRRLATIPCWSDHREARLLPR